MRQLRRNPLRTLLDMAQRYGDLVHIGLGPYHVYLLNHPDLLHEILVRQAGQMRKPRALSRPIADFLGNGLLISHGDYWKQQRHLVQPAFHHHRLDSYGAVMVRCVLQTTETWRDGAVLDVDHEFMKMTLMMVTQTLFSADVSESVDDIAEATKILQRIAYRQGQDPFQLPAWIPIPSHVKKQRTIRLLDDVVMRIIQNRRSASVECDDLLSMLLDAVGVDGKPLTDKQVRDEVMTVLLAGHESTANALTWMWYLLAQHPEAEAKLDTELDTALDGHTPTVSHLKHLPYTTMIVKEALRIYPPAWALPREATEAVEIGGYPIKKGSLLLAVPYTIHRDPRYYDDPARFMPERFADNGESRLPRHTYIPFGGGPRYCVGNNFALMAMQLTLATLHQRYRLRLVPDQQVALDPLLTLRPRYGLHMQIMRKTDSRADRQSDLVQDAQ